MKILIFLSLIVSFFSCSNSKEEVGATDIHFDSLAHNTFCSVDGKKQVVIRSQEDYDKIWAEVYRGLDQMPRVPEVDFEKYTVIAVFTDSKPSGGYDIRIDKVTSSGGKLLVNVTESAPGKDCVVTDAMTNPYDFVKIKKTSKNAEFNINSITKDCK